ncbi:MAG: Gfo/Idh/MocA family protein [Planctomycetota bacterium]
MKLGIIGCGDFLRWQADAIAAASNVSVVALFDPRKEAARRFADKLGGSVVDEAAAIIDDPAIDTVALFVPPWIRADLLLRCVAAGKAILTTKPLAASRADIDAIEQAVTAAGLPCGVIYSRTGNPIVDTAKRVLESGEIGTLAVYKQDWLHHYPQWNDWATDPERNGGPFMDAMVHNLNAARFLAGSQISAATFFSNSHVHVDDIACADTESLQVDFASGASAQLFITWAADLASGDTSGNNREHIDQFFMITTDGWLLRIGDHDGAWSLIASRQGSIKAWPIENQSGNHYQRFAEHREAGTPWPENLATVQEAADDIRLLRHAEAHLGSRFSWPA